MFLGFFLPIATVTSLLPWFLGPIGALASGIGALFAIIATVALGSLVIGIAWAASRPAVGVPALAVTAAAIGGGVYFTRHQKQKNAAAEGASDVETSAGDENTTTAFGAFDTLRL